MEQSLVVADRREDGVSWYRMLMPVREYAEERLEQSGEADEIRALHARYFLALAERAEPELMGRDQVEWLDQLDMEHDNLRAAIAWGLDREADLAMQLAAALWRFWEGRGHVGEGRGWLEAAIAMDVPASAVVRARALGTAGWMAMWQGEYERAREFFEESLDLCRSTWNQRATASALHKLALLALVQGDLSRAIPLLEESVALWREFGDQRGIAEHLIALGTALFQQGDVERASTLFEESLASARASEDRLSTAWALYSLAYIGLAHSEYGRAMALITECIALFQQLGNTLSIAYCLEVAASVAARRQDAARAARLWGASEAQRESLDTPRAEADRRYEHYLEAARSQLDEESYARAEAEGREMTLAQAVEYALSLEEGSN